MEELRPVYHQAIYTLCVEQYHHPFKWGRILESGILNGLGPAYAVRSHWFMQQLSSQGTLKKCGDIVPRCINAVPMGLQGHDSHLPYQFFSETSLLCSSFIFLFRRTFKDVWSRSFTLAVVTWRRGTVDLVNCLFEFSPARENQCFAFVSK